MQNPWWSCYFSSQLPISLCFSSLIGNFWRSCRQQLLPFLPTLANIVSASQLSAIFPLKFFVMLTWSITECSDIQASEFLHLFQTRGKAHHLRKEPYFSWQLCLFFLRQWHKNSKQAMLGRKMNTACFFLNKKYISCLLRKHYTRPGLQVYLMYSCSIFLAAAPPTPHRHTSTIPEKILGLYMATCRNRQILHSDFLDSHKNILNWEIPSMKRWSSWFFRSKQKSVLLRGTGVGCLILMVIYQLLIHTISTALP